MLSFPTKGFTRSENWVWFIEPIATSTRAPEYLGTGLYPPVLFAQFLTPKYYDRNQLMYYVFVFLKRKSMLLAERTVLSCRFHSSLRLQIDYSVVLRSTPAFFLSFGFLLFRRTFKEPNRFVGSWKTTFWMKWIWSLRFTFERVYQFNRYRYRFAQRHFFIAGFWDFTT